MICQGEQEDHRYSCPAAIQSWFNEECHETAPFGKYIGPFTYQES